MHWTLFDNGELNDFVTLSPPCGHLLQATAPSTPAPPACRISHIAGTPRQEAALLGVWPLMLTHLQRVRGTLDVQRDPPDPHVLYCHLTDTPGTDVKICRITFITIKKKYLKFWLYFSTLALCHHFVSGGSRTRWRTTPHGSTTLVWMLMISWKKLSKAKTLKI